MADYEMITLVAIIFCKLLKNCVYLSGCAWLLLIVVGGSVSSGHFRKPSLCDAPVIKPVYFHEYVEILVGSNRTFSCAIYLETQLKTGRYRKQRTRNFQRFLLPEHVRSNAECPTLSNATFSNLTLINVSQLDRSGYYAIENECGSNNFTVIVHVKIEAESK